MTKPRQSPVSTDLKKAIVSTAMSLAVQGLPQSPTEVAKRVDCSQGYVSEVLSDPDVRLEVSDLLERNGAGRAAYAKAIGDALVADRPLNVPIPTGETEKDPVTGEPREKMRYTYPDHPTRGKFAVEASRLHGDMPEPRTVTSQVIEKFAPTLNVLAFLNQGRSVKEITLEPGQAMAEESEPDSADEN